jgi:hypothetical protein
MEKNVMRKELEQKLFETYPKIFFGKDKSIMESLIPFGFECGDGWYTLIYELCNQLQFDTDHNGYPQIEVIQVKEKWSTLRFYTNNANDFQHGMISFAEAMSAKICEDCGTNMNVSRNKTGWIATLCPECRNIRESKKNAF